METALQELLVEGLERRTLSPHHALLLADWVAQHYPLTPLHSPAVVTLVERIEYHLVAAGSDLPRWLQRFDGRAYIVGAATETVLTLEEESVAATLDAFALTLAEEYSLDTGNIPGQLATSITTPLAFGDLLGTLNGTTVSLASIHSAYALARELDPSYPEPAVMATLVMLNLQRVRAGLT